MLRWKCYEEVSLKTKESFEIIYQATTHLRFLQEFFHKVLLLCYLNCLNNNRGHLTQKLTDLLCRLKCFRSLEEWQLFIEKTLKVWILQSQNGDGCCYFKPKSTQTFLNLVSVAFFLIPNSRVIVLFHWTIHIRCLFC